jgi:hypothetical protein
MIQFTYNLDASTEAHIIQTVGEAFNYQYKVPLTQTFPVLDASGNVELDNQQVKNFSTLRLQR